MENATLEELPDGVVVTAEGLTLVLTENGSTGYVWVLGEGAVPVSDDRAPLTRGLSWLQPVFDHRDVRDRPEHDALANEVNVNFLVGRESNRISRASQEVFQEHLEKRIAEGYA